MCTLLIANFCFASGLVQFCKSAGMRLPIIFFNTIYAMQLRLKQILNFKEDGTSLYTQQLRFWQEARSQVLRNSGPLFQYFWRNLFKNKRASLIFFLFANLVSEKKRIVFLGVKKNSQTGEISQACCEDCSFTWPLRRTVNHCLDYYKCAPFHGISV